MKAVRLVWSVRQQLLLLLLLLSASCTHEVNGGPGRLRPPPDFPRITCIEIFHAQPALSPSTHDPSKPPRDPSTPADEYERIAKSEYATESLTHCFHVEFFGRKTGQEKEGERRGGGESSSGDLHLRSQQQSNPPKKLSQQPTDT